MHALTLADLHSFNDEPRILDLRLADALGFKRDRNIRKIIERNLSELEAHGLICAMMEQIKIPNENNPKGAGRPGIEYHLNEAQALLVCMFSRTERAAEVRKLLIDVFLAWRQGEALPEPPARIILPGHPDFSQAVRLVREARLSRGADAALAIWRVIGLPWVAELESVTVLPQATEADPVARFAAEAVEQAYGIVTPAAALWRAFSEWCLASEVINPGQGMFQTRFGRLGFAKRKTGGRSVYLNIRPNLGQAETVQERLL